LQKIISLFHRDHGDEHGGSLVRNEIEPGAEWVVAGEGVATRKWDGTCCLVRDHKLYKRYEVKQGKTPPALFEPACEVDPNTGKQQGWVPVGEGPEDRWHREAWEVVGGAANGTYELLGPAIQGNPEGCPAHVLVPHGHHILAGVPRDYEGLRTYLSTHRMEGIVWHHLDGRMVKIKAKDFGIKYEPPLRTVNMIAPGNFRA